MAANKKAVAKKAPAKRKPVNRKKPVREPVAPVQAPVAEDMTAGDAPAVVVTNMGDVEGALAEQSEGAQAVAAMLAQEEQKQQAAESEINAPDPEQAEAERRAREAGARMMANMLTGAAASGVSGLWGVQVEERAQEQVAEKLAPVLLKNGGGMPEWLLPYKEEFELGICVAGVGFGVWQQHRKQQAEAIAEARKQQQQQQQQPRQQVPRPVSLDPNAHDEAA